jgi:hypothetical protein
MIKQEKNKLPYSTQQYGMIDGDNAGLGIN